MEIIVPPTNYNMPPIDNKVKKINRKKTNILSRYAENFKIKLKKDELIRKKREREGKDYMSVMRNMQRKLSAKTDKTLSAKKDVTHPIKQPLTKSQEKHNKAGKK